MTKTQITKKIREIAHAWKTDDALKTRNVSAGKFRAHIVCIAVGLGLAIGATYIGGIAAHFAVMIPVMPSVIQEAIDRLFNF